MSENPQRALICGSIAYDTIMVFDDYFKKHILPEKVHILNVSFLVPQMRREYGGCAGNIAYNLQLLGGQPIPMATVGRDFGPYADWMDQKGVERQHIREIAATYTAQAFITTDKDDNQITAFHPGAMNHAHENRVGDVARVSLGLISPDGRQGMLEHAAQFAEAGIPFIFDPGQGLPMFNGEELLSFIERATWIAVNDYEAQMLAERTGKTITALAQQVKALIVTRGAQGSHIYTDAGCLEIPSVSSAQVVDPTGCGDAYRAGLLFGLGQGMDWATTGRIASLLGCIKVAQHGTQNHFFSQEQFAERFNECFGYRF